MQIAGARPGGDTTGAAPGCACGVESLFARGPRCGISRVWSAIASAGYSILSGQRRGRRGRNRESGRGVAAGVQAGVQALKKLAHLALSERNRLGAGRVALPWNVECGIWPGACLAYTSADGDCATQAPSVCPSVHAVKPVRAVCLSVALSIYLSTISLVPYRGLTRCRTALENRSRAPSLKATAVSGRFASSLSCRRKRQTGASC